VRMNAKLSANRVKHRVEMRLNRRSRGTVLGLSVRVFA
jgi:hypothetical protein